MKTFLKFAALTLALLFAVNVFAVEKTVTISNPTVVNGTKLEPGEYRVVYKINGAKADITIFKGRKEVVKTTGDVVTTDKFPYPGFTLIRQQNSDGSQTVVKMQLDQTQAVNLTGGDGSASGK